MPIFVGVTGSVGASEGLIPGTIASISPATCLVDGASTSIQVLTSHPYVPVVGDRVGLQQIGRQYVAFPIGIQPFQSYTPTLTQPSAVAKTVNYAKYAQLGKLITGNVRMTCTAVGTTNNTISVGLPTVCADTGTAAVGAGYILKASIRYASTIINLGAGVCCFQSDANANVVGIIPNIALAVGDVVGYQFSYETL